MPFNGDLRPLTGHNPPSRCNYLVGGLFVLCGLFFVYVGPGFLGVRAWRVGFLPAGFGFGQEIVLKRVVMVFAQVQHPAGL